MERKSISKKTRFEVFKRDLFTCQYCGSKAPDSILEIDHIKPISKGGSDDILNLITSCFDCNRGKGKRELSDKAVIDKQINQMQELQERKMQIEMLMDWKMELARMSDDFSDKLSEYFNELTGYGINEKGKKTLSKICKKYGYSCVIDAIDTVVDKYFKGDHDSVELAFKKIGPVCNLSEKPEYIRKAHYIMGIIKNRFDVYSNQHMKESLLLFHESGHDLDSIKDLACKTNRLDDIYETLESI